MSRLPIQHILDQYETLSQKAMNAADTKEMIEISKQLKKLDPQQERAIKIQRLEKAIQENTELLQTLDASEAELIELTEADNSEKKAELERLEAELLEYLTPQDPRDDNDIILEIRAGAGGDESCIFGAEMFKMYSIMAQNLGFKVKVLSVSDNPVGGFKELIAEIRGESVFSWYKYEAGVHRVQRVPATEKQGRVHTSTVSVAIMPLIEKDNDFKLDLKDVEIIASTSSGNGGQSVNTTYSAIRAKHIPTGIEAQSQDERSQVQNKEKALQVLTSRVYNFYEEQRLAKESAERRDQVGNADRSEKIRTYNFPQDRLTDHRYNNNWSQLPTIMTGEIVEVIKQIKKIEAENMLTQLNQK